MRAKGSSREIILYLVFGVLTTLVNLASFVIFDKLFPSVRIPLFLGGLSFDLIDVINTVVAWILAVLFAYVTNRMIVFRSRGPVFRELISFAASRIVTLIVFEIGFIELGILASQEVFHLDVNGTVFAAGGIICTYKYIVKALAAVFVVIGNYILCKIFVFRQNRNAGEKTEITDTGSVRRSNDK